MITLQFAYVAWRAVSYVFINSFPKYSYNIPFLRNLEMAEGQKTPPQTPYNCSCYQCILLTMRQCALAAANEHKVMALNFRASEFVWICKKGHAVSPWRNRIREPTAESYIAPSDAFCACAQVRPNFLL